MVNNKADLFIYISERSSRKFCTGSFSFVKKWLSWTVLVKYEEFLKPNLNEIHCYFLMIWSLSRAVILKQNKNRLVLLTSKWFNLSSNNLTRVVKPWLRKTNIYFLCYNFHNKERTLFKRQFRHVFFYLFCKKTERSSYLKGGKEFSIRKWNLLVPQPCHGFSCVLRREVDDRAFFHTSHRRCRSCEAPVE